MLDSLEIRNFKNLKNFRIDKLERVNLFTGKNNTGKSTILEAVGLFASKCDSNFIYRLLAERGEGYSLSNRSQNSPDQNLKILSSLFTNRFVGFNPGDSISIGSFENTLFGNNLSPANSVRLRFVKYIDESVEETDGNSLPNIISKRIVINGEVDDKNIDYSYSIGMEIKIGDNSYIRPLSRIMTKTILRGFETSDNYQFIKSNSFDSEINGKLWDSITLTEKEGFVIEALQIIEPKVERIAFIGENLKERSAVIKLAGNENVLPLRSMGDGINRVLTMILAIVNSDNGYVLIDEFENGLHYSVQKKLWEIIFILSQKLNVQVFATTHSGDCIFAFEEVLNNSGKNEGKLMRLDNKVESIKLVEYNSDELRIANEHQIETR